MGVIVGIGKSTDRKEYMKNYHKKYIKKKFGFPEPKIKDITILFSNIRNYNVDFPGEELNKKLDISLKNDNWDIEDKKIKDFIYDILDKKGELSPERILRIYNNSSWENAIQKFMQEKGYAKEGDKYVPRPK